MASITQEVARLFRLAIPGSLCLRHVFRKAQDNLPIAENFILECSENHPRIWKEKGMPRSSLSLKLGRLKAAIVHLTPKGEASRTRGSKFSALPGLQRSKFPPRNIRHPVIRNGQHYLERKLHTISKASIQRHSVFQESFLERLAGRSRRVTENHCREARTVPRKWYCLFEESSPCSSQARRSQETARPSDPQVSSTKYTDITKARTTVARWHDFSRIVFALSRIEPPTQMLTDRHKGTSTRNRPTWRMYFQYDGTL